jgi:hypothetical protein
LTLEGLELGALAQVLGEGANAAVLVFLGFGRIREL